LFTEYPPELLSATNLSTDALLNTTVSDFATKNSRMKKNNYYLLGPTTILWVDNLAKRWFRQLRTWQPRSQSLLIHVQLLKPSAIYRLIKQIGLIVPFRPGCRSRSYIAHPAQHFTTPLAVRRLPPCHIWLLFCKKS
jgi:hypothetical protein